MVSRHALASTLIATALAASVGASSTTARADDTGQTQQQKQKDKQKQKAKKAKAETPAPASEPKRATTPAPTQGAIPKAVETVNEDADEAAAKANEDIVGTEAHQSNEQKARDPRLRPKDNRESKKAAEAVGRTTTTAAAIVGSVVQDSTRVTDSPGSYKPFSLEVNPLGLIVGGRFSIQGEWAPTTHHVILVSPHFIRTSADVNTGADTTANQSFTGVGGEIGYRYYTGHRGMNGFFIGPSIIAGVYNAGLEGNDELFTNVGVAADIGVQGIVADHLVLGGGIGIEYLNVSHEFGDLPSAPSAIASSGVKPRLLFSAGYAF